MGHTNGENLRDVYGLAICRNFDGILRDIYDPGHGWALYLRATITDTQAPFSDIDA